MSMKKTVRLALPETVHARLKNLSSATGRTVPGYLRWLVNRHFWEMDQENKGEKQFPIIQVSEDEELH